MSMMGTVPEQLLLTLSNLDTNPQRRAHYEHDGHCARAVVTHE